MTRPPKFDITAGVPVVGFIGPNGAGKTTLAVEAVLVELAAGRTVYSTVQVRSEWGDTIPLVSLRQLLELRDCTVLLDEVSVIFSSRTTQSLPPEVVAFLQTLRHKKVKVIWTAPAWMRCDVLLRDVTQGIVRVVPLLKYHQPMNPWPAPRLILMGLLDTSTVGADDDPERVLRRRIVAPGFLRAWGTFDSHADTPIIGRRNVGGRCPDCGGSRDVPKHSKERHESLGLPWFEDEEGRPAAPLGASGPVFLDIDPRASDDHDHDVDTVPEKSETPA